MKGITLMKAISTSAAALFAFSGAAPAQAPGLAVFDGLQKGGWTLKAQGSTDAGKRVCLGDPGLLIQIQHGNATCSRYVIENTPKSLRVSYKCGNLGHGVTTIRRESSSVVQIHSQGIANNAPFSFSVEGRRTGAC